MQYESVETWIDKQPWSDTIKENAKRLAANRIGNPRTLGQWRKWAEAQIQFERIQELVSSGVLGPELMPEPKYWHWRILKADELPDEFKHFIPLGEVRW